VPRLHPRDEHDRREGFNSGAAFDVSANDGTT
jgi:hypothetical protein